MIESMMADGSNRGGALEDQIKKEEIHGRRLWVERVKRVEKRAIQTVTVATLMAKK
jgi:hypothetical protein